MDGVFGGLGAEGLGVELVDCSSLGGVAEDSTEIRDGFSSIVSSLSVVGSLLLTGIVVEVLDIVAPLLFNNDANIPYECVNSYRIATAIHSRRKIFAVVKLNCNSLAV